MGSLNNNNRSRPIHQRSPMTYRKGKPRLRILTLKQLQEIMDREKSGKRFDRAKTVFDQKIAKGIVWNKPVKVEQDQE